MKALRILLAGISIFTCGLAGYPQDSKPLKIGDKIPDAMLRKIINFDRSQASLKDFKGKVLIIDFWATWCTPCIASFRKLDVLQKKFRNNLVILPVSNEPEKKVRESFQTIPSIKDLVIPSVVEDTVLNKLFPHLTVPHDVIIDQDGKVVAITTMESLTEETIQLVIDRKKTGFVEKKTIVGFPYGTPMFVKDYGQQIQSFSILTNYVDGLMSRAGRGVGSRSTDPDTSLYAVNMTAVDLIRFATLKCFCTVSEFANNRILYKVKDSSRFRQPKGLAAEAQHEWEKNSLYCYNIVVPFFLHQTLYPKMKKELEDYFRIKATLKYERVDCYVITSIDTARLRGSGGKKQKSDMAESRWTFKNYQLQTTFGLLNLINTYFPKPVIYDGKDNPRIDIDFVPYLDDFNALQMELASKGIVIERQKRKLQVVVIEDID